MDLVQEDHSQTQGREIIHAYRFHSEQVCIFAGGCWISILTRTAFCSGIRPLHLVDLKNTRIDRKQPSSATTVSSLTLTAPSPTKADETESHSVANSILSCYGHSTDSIQAPPSPQSHHNPHQTAISISETYAASRPPSPMTFPSSVRTYSTPEDVPMPAYHRPFSLPSVYPISPHLRPENGIIVTIHRQASVDNMV
jgi:hypothetical protein